MSLRQHIASGLRSLLRKELVERELDEELRTYLEIAAEAKMKKGLSRDEAHRAARVEMGSVDAVKEKVRHAGWESIVESFGQDLRYGLRRLRKSPGFTAVAVLILALGIGANTAIFSLINALMLRSLPVEQPKQLVQILFQGWGGTGSHTSYPDFEDFRDRNHALSGVSAVFWLNPPLLDARLEGQPEPISGQLVSGNFFSLLGVHPAAGRLLTPEEDRAGAGARVAVLSHAYWMRRFGGESSALGRSIILRQTPFTIIGVAPPEFKSVTPGYPPDLYVPFTTEAVFHQPRTWLDQRRYRWVQILGRLKPGVSLPQAQADLSVIYQQMLEGGTKPDWSNKDREEFLSQRIRLEPAANGFSDLRRRFSRPVFVLAGMVGLILLITCANIATMLLSRAITRQREFAVRRALGSGRARLVRQLLTENLLLGLAGGAAGLFLASWLSSFLALLVSLGQGHVQVDLRPDGWALVFTLVVSLLTTMLFGLAPAWRSTRLAVAAALKSTPGILGPALGHLRIGKVLVIAQVALCIVLLFGAGLFLRTLYNLETVNPGFNRQNVILFSVDPTTGGLKGHQVADLYHRMLERLHSMPLVRSASLSAVTPIWGGGMNTEVWVEGYTARPTEDVVVHVNWVSPGYFTTLETPHLLGREFGPEDTGRSLKVGIINQAMARYFFGHQNPIGKKFGWTEDGEKRELEIVGVVGDAKYMDMREEPPRTVYLNCFQDELGAMTFEVRTAIRPNSLVSEIHHSMEAIRGTAQLSNFTTFEAQVDESLGHERLIAVLSGLFGGLALLLAMIGLYGLMACAVAQRTNEIGIRMALGAQGVDVLRRVLGESSLLVLAGIAVGLPCALLGTRLVASMLYGLGSTDPLTIVGVILLMAFVAFLACCIPARRAIKVDPLVALRYE
ncbi:MAG: ABC transporter permease [Terriglobia bacterium]